ncbi:MAG TPA: hypothetical protein VM737_08585 [Gemmatimonadota bacterium]|nr:hypothetical protein [Gemmatimonadota bacterium]
MIIPLRTWRAILALCGLTLFACSLTLLACGGGGPAAPDPPRNDRFALSANSLAFGAADAERALAIVNRGSVPVDWRSEISASWLSVSPSGGILAVGETVVQIRVDRAVLAVGSHAGEARFYLDDLPFAVAVTAEKPDLPLARVEPAALNLGADDSSAAVTVFNAGGAPLTWSMAGNSWIVIAPAQGTVGPGGAVDVALAPDRSRLSDGNHQGSVTLSSNGGQATISLAVTVASLADLRIAPATLSYGLDGTSRTLLISNAGGRQLLWSAAADDPWLAPSAASGTVPPHQTRSLDLTVARNGLPPGEHRTTLRLDSNGGPAEVAVRIEVPDPTPPPPPPPDGSVALEGRVVHQFTGSGVAGLQVEFAGATAVTDATGQFTVFGEASNELRQLDLSGGGVHPRRTYARSSHTSWEVIPSSFDMSAFSDVAREYEPRTIRWMQDPQVYIDATAYNFPGGETTAPQVWIDEIESAVGARIAEWSEGAIAPASVTVGFAPPPEGTPGTLVIQFEEDPDHYTSPQTVGMARTYWSSTRAISSAWIWLRFADIPDAGTRRAIFTHELGHGFGMGHMDGSTASIMTPFISTSGLTTFDLRTGGIVYSRSPGNSAPDTDNAATFIGFLAPAAAPAGSYEWVCGDRPERTSIPSSVTRTSSSHRTPKRPGR